MLSDSSESSEAVVVQGRNPSKVHAAALFPLSTNVSKHIIKRARSAIHAKYEEDHKTHCNEP